jgi:glycosyltransferase involved in cell wall biosynthesis
MSEGTASRPPLLVFADDWGRHPSSPQHLVRRLREEFPVLWVNTIGTRQVKADSFTFRRGLEKLRGWGQGLRQVGDRMWVLDLPMLPGVGNRLLRRVNRFLVVGRLRKVLASLGMASPVVLTTLPYVAGLIRGLPRRALVYYCTDDYSHWPSADREALERAEREITREADLILAASRALHGRLAQTGVSRYFPHGVDFAHFASLPGPEAAPPAVSALPRPRIGFFGLIYEKLDFGLLAALAERHRAGSLVMIGPQAYAPAEFARLPNVHFLGPQPYGELPRYLAGLDVLLMPYVDDAMIRQSGPLKLRECLATGKPTVSIDVPEVRALEPHVRVAGTREGFLEAVGQALAEPADSPARPARQRAVEADGWDSRARQLCGHLQALSEEREAAAPREDSPGGRPARVLHLRTVSGRGGGPEKTILNSPRHLQGEYELCLAYVRPEGDPEYDMPARARQMGVNLVDVPERGGFDLRTLRRLAGLVREFRPDLLHAHDYKTNFLGVLLGRWFRVPVMTTMHGYVSRGGRLEAYYRLDRWALRRMDHVVAVSEDLYELARDMRIPASRLSLVFNAIDAEQFRRRHTAAEAKARVGLPPGRLVIGAVGRLAAEKGFDLLIEAVGRLLDQGLDAELVIAGEGEERPRLAGLIAARGRGDRMRLVGHRPDVAGLYEAMDVFALSSLREGLPNVVLEAMALEVPVVATRVNAVPRLIEDGVNGLLVSPGSAEELVGALGPLLGDAALRERLSRAARLTVETRFSFAARMERIRSLYDALLGRNSEQAQADVRPPSYVPPVDTPLPL